jgi:hypothetical protein
MEAVVQVPLLEDLQLPHAQWRGQELMMLVPQSLASVCSELLCANCAQLQVVGLRGQ